MNTSYVEKRVEEAFEKAFLDVSKIFGEGTVDVLMQFLEESYSVAGTELFRRPDLLEEGLARAFRAGGGAMIKQVIVGELYRELKIPSREERRWHLSKHLEHICRILETRGDGGS